MYQHVVLALCLLGASALPPGPPSRAVGGSDCPAASLAGLADRLRAGITAQSVYGVPRDEAAWVFYPVTRNQALPANYVPPDLVWTRAGGRGPHGAQPVREIIVADLQAMIADA